MTFYSNTITEKVFEASNTTESSSVQKKILLASLFEIISKHKMD